MALLWGKKEKIPQIKNELAELCPLGKSRTPLHTEASVGSGVDSDTSNVSVGVRDSAVSCGNSARSVDDNKEDFGTKEDYFNGESRLDGLLFATSIW